MNHHYEMASELLNPPVLVTHDGKRQARPVSQDNLKLASIHSNLAKVYIAETEAMISLAAMMHPTPIWLLKQVQERLGAYEPETSTDTDGDAEEGPEPDLLAHGISVMGDGSLEVDGLPFRLPDPLTCPECRDGKHKNCTLWAYDDNDHEVMCQCTDATHIHGSRK